MEETDKTKLITFWITKWALTTGIVKQDCGTYRSLDDVLYASSNAGGRIFARVGTEAFYTEAEAKAKVRKMAKAKIVLLEKQIEKMRKLAEE